jgi:catechol 2,3-dioxygenase-like lactoylglutathione lyase family enzyme
MDWKIEVVVIPVSDVDRAKHFYSEQVGFVVDNDVRMGETFRVVQLTPPGSACSIAVGTGLAEMPPGAVKGMQLVVTDLEAARAELVERGVDVTEVRHVEDGIWVDGPAGDWNSFIFFHDPDGNAWAVQQVPAQRGGAA